MKIISKKAISRREYWIEEIKNISGNFGDEAQRLEKELENEIKKYGSSTLIDHLRLCGNIPEMY
jgi:type II restriction enzyme